jgi:hypothetical protein
VAAKPPKRSKTPTRDRDHPCTQCGECWMAALRRSGGLCLNCADTTHVHIKRCPVCFRADVPSEFHHVASKRQHPTVGLQVCLNCHAILTKRQMTDWHPSWQDEQHPVRCLFQGMLDLFWLCLRRSHALWALGQFAKLCGQAGWALVGVFGLVGWTGWQAA